jgi:hypothetical protein
MRTNQRRSRTIAALAFVLPLLALGGGVEAKKKPPPTPWTGPVPKADCGPNDRVETGLQGQTTMAERVSGLSELGFNCNLELVGQFEGEGASYGFASFDHCAYYGTTNSPQQQHRGTVVIDASDPTSPQATVYLDDPALRQPWESLKVHKGRQLLAGVQGPVPGGPGFAIYDLSADCSHPVLKASVVLPDVQGHEGDFTPDGLTYYGAFLRNSIYPIDVTDPSNPRMILRWVPPGDVGVPHGLAFSKDGTRAYVAQPGRLPFTFANGLVILDVSDIQFRRPNPQIHVISTLFWEDGKTTQVPLPVTYRGRPHLIIGDELGSGGIGSGGIGGAQLACALGLPPHGFARIIDISDERNPKIVSKLMLEVSDPANCPEILSAPPEVVNEFLSSHYCNVDRPNNPRTLACTYRQAGLRVFDVRDPFHPREIAYYKPPARRTEIRPGSQLGGVDRTTDHAPSDIRFQKHRGQLQLWFTSMDNGFQIVRFTKSMRELLGKDKGKDDDDDDDD